MENVTIVWRDDGDEFIITDAEIECEDPGALSPDEWVSIAARVEGVESGWSPEEIEDYIDDLIENGYDLILVTPKIQHYYF